MEKDLKPTWDELLKAWKINPASGDSVFENLQEKYAEPHRAYHKLQHISDLLDLLERDKNKLERPHWVGMAIWFHDAIYDPSSKENEQKSAELFEACAKKWGLTKSITHTIYSYILATQNHKPIGNHRDLHWFLDADLSILGASPERYKAYAKEIRAEYSRYPMVLYRAGRKAILKKFLERKRLFFTEDFEQELAVRARENLRWEMESL